MTELTGSELTGTALTGTEPTGTERTGTELTGVWTDLVGQAPTVEILSRAVASAQSVLDGSRARAIHGASDGAGDGTGGEPGSGANGVLRGAGSMTQSWLFTGPPGSGRSNAARAFAAALQCPRGGCGGCLSCRTALAGSHADVTLVRTERLSIRVDEVRDLVRKAAMAPTGERWQVLVVEDADRLTEQAADALLKSVEEPASRTVWLLCAPTVEDVVPTIRSRCQLLVLRTPPAAAVAEVLVRRDGVPESVAAAAARASQGHIGRARALATDDTARERRREVLRIPATLTTLGACIRAAARLVEGASEEAAPVAERLDQHETAELEQALGVGTRGARPRGAQSALKELADEQKTRRKRLQRDALDRALIDLMSLYRDVLVVQGAASVELINEEARADIERIARSSSAETTLRRMQIILDAREALTANVAPQLAVEAMTVGLARA